MWPTFQQYTPYLHIRVSKTCGINWHHHSLHSTSLPIPIGNCLFVNWSLNDFENNKTLRVTQSSLSFSRNDSRNKMMIIIFVCLFAEFCIRFYLTSAAAATIPRKREQAIENYSQIHHSHRHTQIAYDETFSFSLNFQNQKTITSFRMASDGEARRDGEKWNKPK